MLLQTNSYIVPKDRRAEHQRLVRKFRQVLARLGCDQFEVYEQVGANWSSAESTGRYVQIMRFRDRKHQLAVQAGERTDPMAQRVIAEFCDLINFPYQQQQGLFAVGFYNGMLSPSAPRAAGQAAAAEAAAPRAGRRAPGAGAAAGFAIGGLGVASGLGASAAGSAPGDVDEAAALDESFGAESEPAGEDVAPDEDLAPEPEAEAEEPPAEEPEPAAAEDSLPLAEVEEAPAEVEAATDYEVAEEAAPAAMEEAPLEEVAGDGQAGLDEPIPLAEPEADAEVEARSEAELATDRQAEQPAEGDDDSLMELDFDLPEEASAVTADETDERSTDFLSEAPAEEQTQQDESPVASGQDEGGVEVIYEELPEPAEASAPAPAAAVETPAPHAQEPAFASDVEPSAEDEPEFAEADLLAGDSEREADASAEPRAGLTPEEELAGEGESARAGEPEEKPAAAHAGPEADRNGQPPPVFAAGNAIDAREVNARGQDEAEQAVTPFDNGWDDEPAEVAPASAPVSQSPPAVPVQEADESADETPHPAHEYETPGEDALLLDPMDEEPAPAARAEAQHGGRDQRAADPEDLDVLLAELDRALPPQRAKNGDYFADEELERALDEALREIHAPGGGHNGGHHAGERLGR